MIKIIKPTPMWVVINEDGQPICSRNNWQVSMFTTKKAAIEHLVERDYFRIGMNLFVDTKNHPNKKRMVVKVNLQNHRPLKLVKT